MRTIVEPTSVAERVEAMPYIKTVASSYHVGVRRRWLFPGAQRCGRQRPTSSRKRIFPGVLRREDAGQTGAPRGHNQRGGARALVVIF